MAPYSIPVSFPGSQGTPLAARLDLPAEAPLAYAIFAHCFTCSKDTKAATFIAAALAEKGIAVLRFDFTGLGGSEGEFANTHFSSNVDDLVAAADYLRAAHRAPALLVGHSLGGAAVLAAASRVPECVAVATLGTPFDPAHALHQIKDPSGRLERDGVAEVTIGGRPFRVRQALFDDLKGHKLGEVVSRLGRALMVMHSPRDLTVDVENAGKLFGAAKHPKSFVSLDPADHLISRREDARYAGHVLAAWAERFVGETAGTVTPGIEGKVVVRETREGKFTSQVISGRHVIRIDEPLSAGGLDTGMSPYDLLCAAVGGCTAMTLRLYADLKKLPLDRVSVELRHEKVHAADCSDCETKEGKVDRIERVVRLEGNLNEAQRAKLLEIADKCPVHRTLHGEVKVATRLEP